MMGTRLRFRRRSKDAPGVGKEEEFLDLDAAELSGVFATPRWLRDVGLTAWLLVGVALFIVGAVWLLSLTQAIVVPMKMFTIVTRIA